MKVLFTTISIVLSSLAFSQVGIDTETPTEKLDVNGNTRLRSLPEKGAENAIFTMSDGTESPSQNQKFEPNRTVVVDANGVLGTVKGLPPTMVGTAEVNNVEVRGTQSAYNSVRFNSGASGTEADTERDRVKAETTFTLGCVTVYFVPALTGGNRYSGELFVKVNNNSTEGHACVQDPEIRFGGWLYRTGSADTRALSIADRTALGPTVEAYALPSIDYNSEEAMFVDFIMPHNKQAFRISVAGYADSALGDENAHVVVGLERRY